MVAGCAVCEVDAMCVCEVRTRCCFSALLLLSGAIVWFPIIPKEKPRGGTAKLHRCRAFVMNTYYSGSV